MSDTLPAAATGLPAASAFDRRSFLATLAAAGVLTGPAAAAPHGAVDDPDAELIGLHALWQACERRRDALDMAINEACKRHVPPEVPDALYWQQSDHMVVCVDRTRACAKYGDGEAARWVYEYSDFTESLRNRLARLAAIDPVDWPCGATQVARIQEILDAFDEHARRQDAADEACGLATLDVESAHESETARRLLDAILRTPAMTVAGLAAKAHALGDVYSDETNGIATLLPKLLKKIEESPRDWDIEKQARAVSISIDAMRLGGLLPALPVLHSATVAA